MITQKTLILILLAVMFCSCKKGNKKSVITKKNEANTSIYVSSKEGKEWNIFGVKITGKILSTQTNGEYSVIITETPPNGGPPVHTHKNEDELFYILKGNFVFNCGDKKINTKQGDYIRLPRGIPHNFINTDSINGITMNTITPGGFENFFDEIAKVSNNNTLKKHEVDSIANKYGVTFIKN